MKLTKEPQASAEPDQPKTEELLKSQTQQKKSPVFLGATLGAFLGLAVAVLVCFFLYKAQVQDERTKQLEEITQQKSSLIADRLSRHLESEIKQVEFFAAQSSTAIALNSENEDSIQNVNQLLQKNLQGVVAVSLYGKEQAELDSERFPPIRFPELALIKEAESGGEPAPEVVNIEQRWYTHYVRAVKANDSDEILGVLWVTSDVDKLKQILAVDMEGLGKASLYQNFGVNNRPLMLSVGEAATDITHTSNISGTNWELEFAAGSNMYNITHINLAFVYTLMSGVTAVCVFLGALLGVFFGRKMTDIEDRKRIELEMSGAGQNSGAASGAAADSLLDVEIVGSDANLLGLDDDDSSQTELNDDLETLSLDDDVFDMVVDEEETGGTFPAEIFRAYDIRGLAHEQITKEFAQQLGKALGSEILDLHENTIAVARDARMHSPELTEHLIRGILSTGCNVLNLGTVPTPLLYFSLETMDEVSSGVMVTASHNGADQNGFKTIVGGVSRSESDIQNLRIRMIKGQFHSGQGQELRHDVVPNYIDTIFSDVALAGELYVVVDAGNAVGGTVAPKLFEELGCRVESLYCDLDGSFPNHDPDPSVESNVQDLIAKVQEVGADLGIALDGDADRLTVVSPTGKIYPADRLLMLFAKDIVSRSPGADVIFDVKSTRHLYSCITSYGGRPVMWKTGHSFMRAKMQETGAVVGAEFSGHIFIRDRWFGFDDGMYAAARLLEILSLQGEDLDQAFEEFPESLISPEYRIQVAEERKFSIVEEMKEKADFADGRMTLIDGIRVDFAHGWGLVRASNTAAELTLRFEADDEKSMHELKSLFVKELKKIESSIEVDWNQ